MIEVDSWKNVIGITIGAISGIIVAFISVNGKKKSNDTDDCLKALAELEKTVIALEDSLKQERKVRGIVEGNWEGMKLAFRVAFDEYDSKFEGHPEDMVMLKTLREIMNK